MFLEFVDIALIGPTVSPIDTGNETRACEELSYSCSISDVRRRLNNDQQYFQLPEVDESHGA